MGRITTGTLKPFTAECVDDKQLVIKMLNAEEKLWFSEYGQDIHKNEFNYRGTSLMPQLNIQRKNLINFGFENDDESLDHYRSIFKHYYKSATDYDHDVINAVHYMRNNRCIFYKQRPLEIGENIKDVCDNTSLYTIDGVKQTLTQAIGKIKEGGHAIFAAFSMS
uniref:Uncharacterized protein n=1 Tax=viral metagenome TaxID=1070528 RepID=A0A6C0CLQ0_9ZZZZ